VNPQAFIIMLNDYPLFVVLDDEDAANVKLMELKAQHQNSVSYRIDAPEFWHINSAGYL
jgi:hypothetical protein